VLDVKNTSTEEEHGTVSRIAGLLAGQSGGLLAELLGGQTAGHLGAQVCCCVTYPGSYCLQELTRYMAKLLLAMHSMLLTKRASDGNAQPACCCASNLEMQTCACMTMVSLYPNTGLAMSLP